MKKIVGPSRHAITLRDLWTLANEWVPRKPVWKHLLDYWDNWGPAHELGARAPRAGQPRRRLSIAWILGADPGVPANVRDLIRDDPISFADREALTELIGASQHPDLGDDMSGRQTRAHEH